MRSSLFPLAVSAGALLALAAAGAAPGEAAGGCCAHFEAPGVTTSLGVNPEARDAPAPEAEPQPTPLDAGAEGLAAGQAYEDVFGMLKDDTPCSRFYGGPRVAVTVFNEFARRLRKRTLGVSNVGLVMSGDYTMYHDMKTGALYRLFEEAAINRSGPFFVTPPPTGARFQVGRFQAATRPAKALMLRHELGHLVRGADGWVLPNDGGDAALSDRNTRTVESRCLGQLLALRE